MDMIDMIIYLAALCQTQKEALDMAEAVIREQKLTISSMEAGLREMEGEIESLEAVLSLPELSESL
jgi:hypothetical protein